MKCTPWRSSIVTGPMLKMCSANSRTSGVGGGTMMPDIKRYRLTAEAVAQTDNQWSWFVRLAHPDAGLEAITSRTFLLSGVNRKTEYGGQQHLKSTSLHGKNKQTRKMLTRVNALLKHWKRTAEQFDSQDIWLRVGQVIATG